VLESRYDSSVPLVRLLCIAIHELGGVLEIDYDRLHSPDEEFEIRQSEEVKGTVVYRVRKLDVEVGDVLDVNTLSLAEYENIQVDGKTASRLWTASANGVTVTLKTEDLTADYYYSPIRTMRTRGVALVDSSGQMATHSVVNR
jgi:hypothetical protein